MSYSPGRTAFGSRTAAWRKLESRVGDFVSQTSTRFFGDSVARKVKGADRSFSAQQVLANIASLNSIFHLSELTSSFPVQSSLILLCLGKATSSAASAVDTEMRQGSDQFNYSKVHKWPFGRISQT